MKSRCTSLNGNTPDLKAYRGIRLDVGCRDEKQPGFVGINSFPGKAVDIVHDLESFPYPIGDGECLTIIVPGIAHRIKPWLTVDFFNELWRIMRGGCQLVLSVPYAGSPIYWQDPASCNGFTESTFFSFDRRSPSWLVHKPKPWLIEPGFPAWQMTGTIEVLMRKDDSSGDR